MITNHENFPAQIDRILSELQAIKNTVSKLEKPEEIPKRLTVEKALEFLAARSFEMSKSQLYKKVAAREIPHYHFGNRVIFDTEELLKWCEQNLNYKKQMKYGSK